MTTTTKDASMMRLEELKEFKKKCGHCKVPRKAGVLGIWVSRQREIKRKGLLESERVAMSDDMDFKWQFHYHKKKQSSPKSEESFNNMSKKVEEYVKIKGHGIIPQNYDENPKLGVWVKHRRAERKKGLLSQDKINKLTEEVGLVWKPHG